MSDVTGITEPGDLEPLRDELSLAGERLECSRFRTMIHTDSRALSESYYVRAKFLMQQIETAVGGSWHGHYLSA